MALTHNDLRRSADGYQVQISESKTDPFRKGVSILIAPSGDSVLCPVLAMDGYLSRAMAKPGNQCFVFADGQRLLKPKFSSLLKVLAREIGVPSENYSTHSFRIGAATTAAAAGILD